MEVVIIGQEKSSDLALLQNAFEAKGFENAPFIKIDKLGLFTEESKTKIVAGTINFRKYDAVFLKAGPQFTQFVEPFLDELVEEGIYCQVKPESYYIMANKPFMYTLLNSKGIRIQKTIIVPGVNLIEASLKELSFPILVKTFVGNRKTQNIIVESERALKSFAKSIKTKVDAITLQEYLAGNLDYCFVIGKEVFAVERRWNEKKLEHSEKGIATSLSEKDAKMALNATRVCGADIATVKMINANVMNVSPIIDFDRFNKALGKDMQTVVASHYWQLLEEGTK